MAAQTWLITGSSRGFGRALAGAALDAGDRVVATARKPEQLADLVERFGDRVLAIELDVTDAQAAAVAIDAGIARFGRLDVVVNNAGGNIPEPFVDVTEEHLDHLLDLNVRAAFLVAQAAAKTMLAQPRSPSGGVIINMTSQMGHVGAAGRTVYCMTKAGIEGLTKAMAVELAPHNIRVNAVAPTFIETPMTAPFFAKPEFRKWVLDRIPLGRLGQLGEVASAIVFLASPAAALMTGTSLVLDGGWTAQ